jgi:hypothetical protein
MTRLLGCLCVSLQLDALEYVGSWLAFMLTPNLLALDEYTYVVSANARSFVRSLILVFWCT